LNLEQTPTTRQEAVNYLLLTIGEHPVNTLEKNRSSYVDQAQQMIHRTSRQVQSRGLYCNSEENYKMSLSPVDYGNYVIEVPENILKIDASNDNKEVVRRGDRLYDKENHTFYFEEGIECDIVWFLEFEDLPQVVRDYITIKASRIYQSKIVGSEALYQFSMREEQQAYLRLKTEEIDTGDYNMLENQDIMQRMRRF